MATEGLRVDNQQDSIDALSREAETLKKKLAEEKAKLCDVDRKYIGLAPICTLPRMPVVDFVFG